MVSKNTISMSRGQRFEKAEKQIAALEQRLRNMEMSHRIFQAMLERISKTLAPMEQDLRDFIGKQRDIQYRIVALQDILNIDVITLNDKANDHQIKDFHEASDKEDLEKGYLVSEIVSEDSAILLTSVVQDDKDKGILRSKVLMSEVSLPQLRSDLIGKKVGDRVAAVINGVNHEIEILGIRQVPPQVEPDKCDGKCTDKCDCDNEVKEE